MLDSRQFSSKFQTPTTSPRFQTHVLRHGQARVLRRSLELSLEEMSHHTGVSITALSRYECGLTKLDEARRMAVSRVLLRELRSRRKQIAATAGLLSQLAAVSAETGTWNGS